jgi:hypothetical protein
MSIRRIIVVQEPAGAARVLDAVAEAAAALEAELLGLFLEDVELLHFAGLPFAREIGVSARPRGLDVQTMERRLHFQAEEARRALAAATEGKALRWSFRVERGSVPTQLRKALADADVVVLPGAGGGRSARRSAALLSAVELSSAVVPALERLASELGGNVYLLQPDAERDAARGREGELRSSPGEGSCIRLAVGENELARLLLQLWRGATGREPSA